MEAQAAVQLKEKEAKKFEKEFKSSVSAINKNFDRFQVSLNKAHLTKARDQLSKLQTDPHVKQGKF